MPLPNAAPRKLLHNRDIVCQGYEREDGLWDIEGCLVDTKSYSFTNQERGVVSAGAPVHHMTIRLTIDADMVIHAALAASDATPFGACAAVTEGFTALVGLRIGPGWRLAVRERMGGVKGCTHLTDMLLGPLSVTAYQTIGPSRATKGKGDGRPPLLNSCHAFASDGAVTKRAWPEFYTGTDGGS